MSPRVKASQHSPEVRSAVIAALLAGQSVSQVAKQHKLPKGTVSNWKLRHAEKIADGSRPTGTQINPDGKSIGDLLVELVRENLKGLIAGAKMLQDVEWMKKQSAAEVGTLLGITNDKTVRMLEALDASAAESPIAPEPTA